MDIRILQERNGKFVEFSAWQKTEWNSQIFGSLTTIDGQWYGMIGSEHTDRALLSYYPESDRLGREAVCAAWRDEKENHAYSFILEAYPHAAPGERSRGRIVARVC